MYEKQDVKIDAPTVVAFEHPDIENGTNPLSTMKGVVIKQDTQPVECLLQYCFLYCYEQDNVYRYAPLPKEKSALRSLSSDKAGWRPTMPEINGLEKTYVNQEKSNCLLKTALACFGCVTCRPFEMDLTPTDKDNSYMHIDRKFAFGGLYCCPHNAEVSVGGQVVGRVVEDWNCNNPMTYFKRCFEYCFMCRVPYDLQIMEKGALTNRYRINVNHCACGPHFNFCGGTIFCNDQLFDVAPYTADGRVDIGNPSGKIQRTYGGKLEPEACWRWFFCSADNLIVEWEEEATVEERALYLTAATLLEYVFFEGKDKTRAWLHYGCISGADS